MLCGVLSIGPPLPPPPSTGSLVRQGAGGSTIYSLKERWGLAPSGGGFRFPFVDDWKLDPNCGENKASLAGCAAVLHGRYAGDAWLTCARGSMYYAGGNRSEPVLSGAGCGAREDRRNYWRVFARQEELRLPICQAGKSPVAHYVGRKSTRWPGINSCQGVFRIRNVSIPDQNGNGSLEKQNNMLPAHSGSSMFRAGKVYRTLYTDLERNVPRPQRQRPVAKAHRIRHTVFCRG